MAPPSATPTKPGHGEYHRLEGETLEARLLRAGRLEPVAAASIAIHLLDAIVQLHETGGVHRAICPRNVFLARSAGQEFVKLVGAAKAVDAIADTCVDVYAAGMILRRCLDGAEIDADLSKIADRAIASEPTERFATADAFRKELVRWHEEQSRVDELLADFLEIRTGPPPPPVPSPYPTKPRFSAGVATRGLERAVAEPAPPAHISVNVRRIVPLVVVGPD